MPRWRASTHALVMGLGIVAALSARASPSFADTPRVHQLRHDVPLDVTVIVASLGVVFTTEVLHGVKPRACRWCDRTEDEDTLNGVDRAVRNALRWEHPGVPGVASNAVLLGAEPVTMFVELGVASSSDNAKRALPVDVLVVSEAAAVSVLFNQAAKLTFARERPFVHARTPEERESGAHSDDNVSFYSGHTALGFSIAVASGTVATLRGYRLMPLVWATLLPLAATTGILRIGADKHYFTDVLGGALMGSAIGALLPLVFHNHRGDERVETSPTPAGTGPVATPLRAASAPLVTFGGGF